MTDFNKKRMKNIKFISLDKSVTILHTDNGSRNEDFMTDTVTTVETKPETEQTTQSIEPPKAEPFKSFLTQEDFDNETAKIRGNAERKTKAELLKTLGIDSEDKLEAIKKAYENSLTEQEKVNEQLKQLDTLRAELAENKAIITALTKLSNKPSDEVVKLVKMAKGLVSDEVTIEQALDEVMKMIQQKPQVPVSQVVVTTPETTMPTVNPFKDNNMTEMGKMIKENPEKAKELAKLANFPVTW